MVNILDENIKKILEKHYYDIESPGSFGGVHRLSKASGIPLKLVKEWLTTQDTYTLHKPQRFKFKRRKVLAYGIGDLIQSDLIDLSKLSKYNAGMKYILTTIDVFSKFAYAIPLKSKNAETMLEAFKKLFKQLKFVVNLQTDLGKEFYNRKLLKYFKRMKINHFSSQSDFKACVVERFIRTLKSKLFRIFTHTGSYKYIHNLKSILKSYNSSIHRTTGYAPINVTPELEPKIFEKVYGYQSVDNYKYDTNDTVRISKNKRPFRKGYLPNWTDEVFVIYKRYPTNPPTYLLKDLKGANVKGKFYGDELQKVSKTSDDFWKVDEILKSRGKGQNKEYFVKWKGFDQRFNSWVKAQWMK